MPTHSDGRGMVLSTLHKGEVEGFKIRLGPNRVDAAKLESERHRMKKTKLKSDWSGEEHQLGIWSCEDLLIGLRA